MKKFFKRLNSVAGWRGIMWANIVLAALNLAGVVLCFNGVFVLVFLCSVCFAIMSWLMIEYNEIIEDVCAKNRRLADIALGLVDKLEKYYEHFGELPGEEEEEEKEEA